MSQFVHTVAMSLLWLGPISTTEADVQLGNIGPMLGCVQICWYCTHPSIGIHEAGCKKRCNLTVIYNSGTCVPITTIHLDEWAVYRNVQQLFMFPITNHSLHFVNLLTGDHTQIVDSYLAQVKLKFSIWREHIFTSYHHTWWIYVAWYAQYFNINSIQDFTDRMTDIGETEMNKKQKRGSVLKGNQ